MQIFLGLCVGGLATRTHPYLSHFFWKTATFMKQNDVKFVFE